MDRFCLEYDKRCIMWDDKDGGFFLVGCRHRCGPARCGPRRAAWHPPGGLASICVVVSIKPPPDNKQCIPPPHPPHPLPPRSC
jgi:hypothetical protein